MEQDREKADNSETNEAWIGKAECVTGILVSVVALSLFVIRSTHAGSLWRDEAESVQSAQMPLPEMLDAIQYSSFPILFPFILRAYIILFGTGDPSLRVFGLLVGVFLLLASWLPLKKVSGSVPLLSLSLIGLNANFLIAGMSLRGYGLGSLLMLAAFLCTVAMLIHPTLRTATAVFLADLVCSQCLFLNLPLVLAINGAAIWLLFFQKNIRQIWVVAGLTILCSASYIFYISQFLRSGRVWAKILKVPASLPVIWQSFVAAFGEHQVVAMIWVVLIAITLVVAGCKQINGKRHNRTGLRGLSLFAFVLIPFAMIGSYLFVRFLPRPPEVRYFLPLTVVLGATVDLIWRHFPMWFRVARIGLALAATAVLPVLLWPALIQAESNAKAIAEIVRQYSKPTDLIVVNPWSFAVSFNWYYHGSARWISVPMIEDHRVHRYDLLLNKMESAAPLAGVEDEIAGALKRSSRVWLVGQIEVPPAGENPLQLAPAPDPKFEWEGAIYRKSWSQQIGLFLLEHVPEVRVMDTVERGPISSREDFSLYRLEGWKD